MSLTILKRPQGFKLGATAFTATVTDDGSGNALFTLTQHGFITGSFTYITGNFEQYNGYWYVTKLTNNTFNISEYATASIVRVVNTGTVTFYKSILTHGWNSVHLPIIYKLSSTLWPTNTADTARSVSSFSSDGGFVRLNVSGDIKASGQAQELEWVYILDSNNLVTGIYKIINYVSDTAFTIDLAYASTYDFSFSTVQYYYMNYTAKIRVYGGISTTFTTWGTQKPLALICEIDQTPNTSGIITLVINEYLKQKIGVLTNNLTLDTLPNNIDAFCNFYIEYAESYDKSTSGYTLGTYTSAYTSDANPAAIQTALNADLPFKNLYAGWPSAYMFGSSGNKGAFLTNFARPSVFPGNYFDLSFILSEATIPESSVLVQERYRGNAWIGTTTTDITNVHPNYGVFRMPIAQIGNEDRQIVYVSNDLAIYGGLAYISPITIDMDTDCTSQSLNLTWLNNLGGFDYWVFTAQKKDNTEIEETGQSTKDIFRDFPDSFGDKADTIDYETFRNSRQGFTVVCQYVTLEKLQGIRKIKESPLVQIVVSQTDRRTVLVDADSFTAYEENDKTFTISFSIRYTNRNPSQKL